MSFTAKVYEQKSDMLWLVKGEHKSLKAWWFVLVNPYKLESFKLALKTSELMVTKYGEVISSGYGENPTSMNFKAVMQKGFKLKESVAS